MALLGRHAVVIGGSVSGLLAARVLADAFDRVTVVDRDALDVPGARGGVPQARHVHALLPAGNAVIAELFPALLEELAAGGAPLGEIADVRLYFSGYALRVPRAGLPVIEASRSYLERGIRARVKSLPGVTIQDQTAVMGLEFDGDRVSGVRMVRGDAVEQVVAADLVVDASGRGSRVPNWLRDRGFRAPEEDRVRVDVVYVSRRYRLPAGVFDGAQDVVVSVSPDTRRGAALQRLEDGDWLVTLSGYLGQEAPVDHDGWLRYAHSLPLPEVYAALAAGQPLTDPVRYRFPDSVRRRYERLRGLPARLLVVGDAMCSFNPVYAQGMSVAALEALGLRECLAGGLAGLERRFVRRAASIVDVPWDISVGGDLRFPEVKGSRTPRVRFTNGYLRRVHAAGSVDPAVALAFIRVAALLDSPTALLRPAMVLRVLRAAGRATPAWQPGPADRAVITGA